jgi:copper chaperone CopZ
VKKALAKVPGAAVRSAGIGIAVVTIQAEGAAAAGEQDLVDAVAEAGYTVLELNELDAA